MARDDPRILAVEEWFLAHGFPHFIHGYSASRHVFTRTLPVLIAVLVIELIFVLDEEWPLALNLAAAAGCLATTVGVWVVVNRRRGRAAFARPEDLEAPELLAFVILAPALAVVAGGQVATAATMLAANLGLLALVYFTTSYGVLPMTRWAARRLTRGVHGLVGLVVRVLPLLLLFVIFLFFTAESWEAAATLDGPFLPAVVGLFTALGVIFILGRLPQEVGNLGRFTSARELVELASRSPAAELVEVVDLDPASAAPVPSLSHRHWGNIALVLVFSQGVLVALTSVLMGAFLVVFGTLAMGPDIVRSWTGGDITVLVEAALWGREVAISAELVQVAVLLATISGFSFTLSLLTDGTYRSELMEDVLEEVREALAVRAVYLQALGPGQDDG